MGIPHHPFDARQGGQLVGGALGVAAGDQDAGRGVLAMDAADGVAEVFVGRGRDGAGVEHYQVRGGAFEGGLETGGRQRSLERRAIGLGGPATEALDKVLPHYPIVSDRLRPGWQAEAPAPQWNIAAPLPVSHFRTVQF